MQKTMILAAAVLAGVSVVAEEKALNDWENPAVNSINRMPAATYAVPLADATAATTFLSRRLRKASSSRMTTRPNGNARRAGISPWANRLPGVRRRFRRESE